MKRFLNIERKMKDWEHVKRILEMNILRIGLNIF